MKRLFVVVLLVAGCAAGPVGAAPTIYATPAASLAMVATPTPSPVPKPTPKPKPTLRPAALTLGTLNYTSNACYSSAYTDAQGHALSGIVVEFKVKVSNSGQRKSEMIPISIETTDWFDTNPRTFNVWDGANATAGAKTISLEALPLGPGKSETLRWSILFQTALSPHYTVTVLSESWTGWTSVSIC